MLGAGYFVRRNGGSVVLGIAAAVVPVVVGDILTFLFGRHLLARALRTGLGQRLFRADARTRAEEMVRRHRWLAVVLGRFLIQMRGPVYLAIGEAGGPVLLFLAIDLPIAIVDVGLIFLIGYWFGAHETVAGAVRAVSLLVALAALAVLVFAAVSRRRRRHA